MSQSWIKWCRKAIKQIWGKGLTPQHPSHNTSQSNISPEHMMQPPWEKFDYHQYSLGWRMGGGEEYMDAWGTWFCHLNDEEQHAI